MIKITRPIVCPNCGKDMDNYSTNTTKENIIFRCKCGAMRSITFDEYTKVLRNNYQIK